MTGKWLKTAVCLLAAGTLLAGCGKREEGKRQEQETENRQQEQSEEIQNQERQEGTPAVKCLFVSMDRRELFPDSGDGEQAGQILNMQCLATEKGIYAAGVRRRQDTAEMAVYRLDQEGRPEMAVSWPSESLLAWCENAKGIAVLTVSVEKSGNEIPENDIPGNKSSNNEVSGNEILENDNSNNKISDNKTSDNKTLENKNPENKNPENKNPQNTNSENKNTGNESSVNYILHMLEDREGEAPEETENRHLTELFRKYRMDMDRDMVMAVWENLLILAPAGRDTLHVIDLSSESEVLTLSLGEKAESIQCTDGETIRMFTDGGNLYQISVSTGKRETLAENLSGRIRGIRFGRIGESCIYAGKADGLYAAQISGGQEKKLADFDLTSGDAGSMWMDQSSGKGIIAVWSESTREIYQYDLSLDGSDSSGNMEKETIVLESYRIGDDLKKAARKFNRLSDQYWIEITEGKEEDYDSYEKQYNARLAAGEGPDLIVLREDRVKNDMEKGIYENLMPYIQRDLEPDDYIQSALYAFRQDDFVCGLGSSFALSVMVTEKEWLDCVGNMSLLEVFRGMEEEEIPVFLEKMDKSRLLYWCLARLGKGIFDMDKVRDCILFAENYCDDAGKYTAGGAMGKDIAAVIERIGSPLDMADIEYFYNRSMKEAVITGIPFEEGNAVCFEFNAFNPLGINAASGHKEGAWAFIQFLLEEEYQFSMVNLFDASGLFPIRRDAFEAMLKRYEEPKSYDVYADETGEIVTVTAGYTLSRCAQTMSDYELEAVTEEQTERLRKMAEQGKMPIREAFEAEIIIGEEAGSYFEGDKTFDQTMEVIRRRLEMYEEERK